MLRAVAQAHRQLAELKGRAASIPNQGILIDTRAMPETKASSKIKNIVTTQDELFSVRLSRQPIIPCSKAGKRSAAQAISHVPSPRCATKRRCGRAHRLQRAPARSKRIVSDSYCQSNG